jgi:hypothetical protein
MTEFSSEQSQKEKRRQLKSKNRTLLVANMPSEIETR